MRDSSKTAFVVLLLVLCAGHAFSDDGNNLSGGSPHTAYLRLPDGRFHRVPYTSFGGLAIAQSDIILGTHEDVQKQTAYNLASEIDTLDYKALNQKRPDVDHLKIGPAVEVISPFSYAVSPHPGHARWPRGRVPFTVDSSITDENLKKAIETAAKAWNRLGIVQMKPVEHFSPADIEGTLPLRIYSTSKLGENPDTFHCASHIGYDSKPHGEEKSGNVMHLSNKCGDGTLVHEFGHVLGLQHEHLRSDRDNFMDADLSLIVSAHKGNYKKNDGETFGLGYDPCSIMHYKDTVRKDWTTTGKEEKWFTWKFAGRVALDLCRKSMHDADCSEEAPGQRCKFSQTDIEIVRQLYQH